VTDAVSSPEALARAEARPASRRRSWTWIVPALYILFLMLPIYWLVNMSFKTTNEILGTFSLWPQNFTLDNYRRIFTDPVWYWGYFNSLIYVTINTSSRSPWRCPRPTPSRATASSATSTCSSGC
jgi:glycerol transport system permease protein